MIRTKTMIIFATLFSTALAGEPSVDSMIKAWKRRSSAVKSFRFTWTGTHSSFHDPSPGEKDRKLELRDLRGEFRLAGYDRRNVFHLRDVPTRNLETDKIMNLFHNLGINDNVPTILDRHGSDGLSEAQLVNDEAVGRDLRNVELCPILLCYRPLNLELGGAAIRQFSTEGKTGMVGYTKCLIVSGPGSTEFWVDPASDYVVKRWTDARADGELRTQIDMSFSAVGNVQVLHSWNIVAMDERGQQDQVFDVSVADYTINPPLSSAAFAVKLPPSTLVTDYRTPEAKISFIDDKGARRSIEPAEAARIYNSAKSETFPSLRKRIK